MFFFQFVSATFWGIYSVDRELIFPKVYDELIPPWLNHALVSSWCFILLYDQLVKTMCRDPAWIVYNHQ